MINGIVQLKNETLINIASAKQLLFKNGIRIEV